MPAVRSALVLVLGLVIVACSPADIVASGEAADASGPASTPIGLDPSGAESPGPERSSEGSPDASVRAKGAGSMSIGYLPYGQWATVTADGLRLRYSPGLDEQFDRTLDAGTSIFVLGSGAVNVDGFSWYYVAHDAGLGSDGMVAAEGVGWIAGASSEGTPRVENLAWTDASCPPLPIDAETFAGLSGWALEACDTGTLTGLVGMLDQPIEGPITPFRYEPEWLWFSPWFLTDPDEANDVFLSKGWNFAIHHPPSIPTDALRRGDLVRISGHLNDPAASDCDVMPSGDAVQPTEGVKQAFQLECNVAFVVDTLEVIGHTDLPEG